MGLFSKRKSADQVATCYHRGWLATTPFFQGTGKPVP